MPGLNSTGPEGKGKMTGRKRGHCNSSKESEIVKSENKSAEEKEVVLGVGRGGKPRGGGKGNCAGGRKGSGKGLGKHN